MNQSIRLKLWACAGLGLLLPSLLQAAPESLDPAAVEFFEKKIRPVLAENCYSCHSQESSSVKGGLYLDSRSGLAKGGQSGPAIVPGNPDGSLLIQAIRHTLKDLRMPAKGEKLPPEQIADLETWVRMGAPDPRDDAPPKFQRDADSHWAFQMVARPELPSVKNQDWVQSPVDAFILARLEEKGMQPAAPADKRTLLRRASFDLTGLPPTLEEVAAFLADDSPGAFAKVVERLLGSPHYGERWARHWLDVARYADTKGYVFEEERRFPYSYTYRDYVIRSLNEDLPFDRFIIEQIAADHLELGDDKRPLAALGFLTLGRRFLNNQHDIIDDRIDVVTRGTMGLTVSCARCHDHKYDPIPIADYYSLYGVFASSSEPAEKPLLGTASLPAGYDDYVQEREKRESEYREFKEAKTAEALKQVRERTGDYLLTAYEGKRLADNSQAEALARERKLDPTVVRKWAAQLEAWKDSHPVFAPWHVFAAMPEETFAEKAPALAASFTHPEEPTLQINPLLARALAENPPASMKALAEIYGRLFADAEKAWTELRKDSNAEKLADPALEALREILYGPDTPLQLSEGETQRLFDVPSIQRVRALRRKLEEVDATHPGAPPRAMALVDNPKPQNPRVFVRGNPQNPGPEIPRQFLEVLAGENRRPFEKGSGRLELAQAIANPENPLTARVLVNRVWLQYFSA